MIIDIISGIFVLLAMLAGYLGGGFKEIIRLAVMIALLFILKIPSISDAMLSISGPRFYTTFFIISFLLSYFLIYKLIFFALSDFIKVKEGALGATNKTLGIVVGFFKGVLVLFTLIWMLEAIMGHGLMIELKPYTDDSVICTLEKAFLNRFNIVFF